MHFLLSLLSIFLLQTQNSTLAIDLEKGRDARIVYYGSTVTDPAVFRNAGLWGQTAYPAYGLSGAAETALAITQADGNKTLSLSVTDWTVGTWDNGELLTITLKDSVYPVTVRLYYKSFREEDMIETWTRTDNDGKKPSCSPASTPATCPSAAATPGSPRSTAPGPMRAASTPSPSPAGPRSSRTSTAPATPILLTGR